MKMAMWSPRSGNPLLALDLARVSVDVARAIVVLATAESPERSDARVLRIVLSLMGVHDRLKKAGRGGLQASPFPACALISLHRAQKAKQLQQWPAILLRLAYQHAIEDATFHSYHKPLLHAQLLYDSEWKQMRVAAWSLYSSNIL